MAIRFRKRRYRRARKRSLPSFSISREARNSIIILLLFSLGIFTLLAWIGAAGMLGADILNGISFAVGGNLVLLVVVVSWLTAFLMLNPDRFTLNAANYIGLFVLLLSVTSIFHLQTPPETLVSEASQGNGGGMIGLALALPLMQVGGVYVLGISAVLLFFLSIILIFNTSLSTLLKGGMILLYPFKALAQGLISLVKARGDKESDDDEDKYDDEEDEEYEGDEDDDEDEDEDEESDEDEDEEGDDEEDDEDEDETIKQPALTKLKFKRQKIDIPLSLLTSGKGKPTSGDIKSNQQIIKNTLASFNIECEMGEVQVGPTVTQFTLTPAVGVRISKISGLNNDLALALAAHPIRIEAPIPGKPLVGIEVPNKSVATVKLRDIMEDTNIIKTVNPLEMVLGRDVSGKSWIEDLAVMPHLLIAGATGSGKSVCLNTVIISLLYQNHPNDLKLILVDPKRVELNAYNKIPHLLTPVITEMPKVINALKWTLREMDRRYQLLSQVGKRNIIDYNKYPKAPERLPYIVFVIDELADLMSVSSSDVEAAIIRLAQMSRAVGIHLVVATQRPSVDVITGLIKANIPARIAFAVASSADSRTILDNSGAEKLLGRGDMLHISAKLSKPKRIQGVYVTDDEIQKVVDYLADSFEEVEFAEDVTERQKTTGKGGGSYDEDDEDGELIEDAIEAVRKSQRASATLLQRKLRVGYARAARILDALEERGIVGPAEGSKPREVLIGDDPDDTMADEDDGSYEVED